LIKIIKFFRQVYFDLVLEKEPFIGGMTSLEDAVASMLYLCFVANIEYPKVLF
jgi:hypothetical protein